MSFGVSATTNTPLFERSHIVVLMDCVLCAFELHDFRAADFPFFRNGASQLRFFFLEKQSPSSNRVLRHALHLDLFPLFKKNLTQTIASSNGCVEDPCLLVASLHREGKTETVEARRLLQIP
jgi:hypothetical protein